MFTVTLTGGTGVAAEIAATPTITGGTGYAVPGVVLLGNGVTTGTFRVVVDGAATVTVGLDNTDPLDPPTPLTYTTTLPADYTINAPLTVPAGYKTTRIRVALRPSLTLSNPLPVALYDDQTGSDQGTWYLDLDDTPITPASDGKARITLTQTTRFVDVQYKAASTKGVGVVDTVHLSVLADDASFGAPASVPLDVYDPAVFYAVNIAATYPGFPGYAGTVTYAVLDDSQVAIYSNPTGRVWAGDTDGKYLSTIIMRLESGGSVTWTEPTGWTGGAAQYEFDAPRAVGPVLSALDLGSVTTELQRSGGGVRLASFASMGITTFTAAQVRADPNYLHKMMASALVNKPSIDQDGNLLYKADDGTTILLTIPVNDDDGTLQLGAPV